MEASERVTVVNDVARSRFAATVKGGEAKLLYARPDPKTIDLQHTEVPSEARGHHVAESLAAAAFAYARQSGLKVIPTCPFVRQWLLRHPEERDLVVSGRG
jgi:predicted GNAT family acetyltransferase